MGQSHGTWRESGKPAKHTPAVGTTFHFTLSAAARVQVVFRHTVKGVTSHGKCVAVKPHLSGKTCALAVSLGTLGVNGKSGLTTLNFAGKLAGRRLAPGRYQAVISVREPAGAAVATATLTFTIVR